jgi:hypothetical protein
MELFGKEINIDFNKKQIKLSIIVGAVITIIFLFYFLVVSSIGRVYDKKDELAIIKQQKEDTVQTLRLLEKRYAGIEQERGSQQTRLEELLKEFESHSFKDEARLKEMVQKILDYLNIELLEIGKTETTVIEENSKYQRKMIPYRIMGNGRDVALFFFYLENTKTLLTLKKSRLEVFTKPFKGENIKEERVEVKFKLGYYKILDEERGGNNEKTIEVKGDENPLVEYISNEVYEEGRTTFYGNGDRDGVDMFSENKDQFSGSYEDFKAYVESSFKPTILITQNGVNSAVVYFSDGECTKRIIIKGSRVIEKGDNKYYINVFKDRVEIKKGKNGRVVPLYLRERRGNEEVYINITHDF